MQTINLGESERELSRMQANREELVERLARTTRTNGGVDPLPGLHFYRATAPTKPLPGVSLPGFCVIAQGSKQVFLGEDHFRYDPAHYLLATVELPTTAQIVEASPERPYLSMRLDLDLTLVSTIMMEAGRSASRDRAPVRAMDVSALDAGLLDAVVRLARLVDTPAEAQFLAPLIKREIVYRLLVGEQGDRLCYLAAHGGQSHRMVQALERLRTEFNQPLRIENVARDLGMSVSGFHHHFKAVTGMSPLQYQKQVRLQEARRLMLGEHLDAASTAYRVGYEDASHFNREYKRLFGEPPVRDVARLRAATQSRSMAAD